MTWSLNDSDTTMLKSELDTPALVLRKDFLEENLMRMRDLALAHGKKLRPHAKTHKCPAIAKMQLGTGNCVGVCAAKLSEAAALADAGIEDILITSPVAAPTKRAPLAHLNARIPGLATVVDSTEAAKLAEDAAAESGRRLRVLVDIDPVMGRTGVSFAQAPGFADYVAAFRHLELVGVQCYAGHLQHLGDARERYRQSRRLMTAGAAAFREIRSRHPSCAIFTGTGTGTCAGDLEVPELTDLQVGSYCLMDAEYLAALGGDTPFKPALRILSSVVSANHPGMATIDAGTKAIYVTPDSPPLCIDGLEIQHDFKYDWSFGDEHGRLTFPPGKCHLRPGERLELVVSHCDPTVNLFDNIYLIENEHVIGKLSISLRGCAQ